MLVVPRDVSGSACTGSVLFESFMHSLQDLRVPAHTKVIIGAPHGDSLILVGHVSAGELFGETIDVVEVAVGLILMLLVKLGIVESLVVELGSFVLDGTDGLDMLRVRDCNC
jgi:hypothetical protein